MLLTYTDESGDAGSVSGGGSRTYVLGSVIVDDRAWNDAFDQLVDFRRFLKSQFDIPARAELKANFLLRNAGPLRSFPQSESARHRIYRMHLRLLEKIDCRAFAVVVRKDLIEASRSQPADHFETAWKTLLERLETTSRKEDQPFLIVHDEGQNDEVRKMVRKVRRYNPVGSVYGGSLARPARRLVDDAIPRDSRQSYFLQLADLVAYAAFRAIIPPPARTVQIVPASMWGNLRGACHTPVNWIQRVRNPGQPPGIVIRD